MVRNGHPWSAIQTYTYTELMFFLQAAQQLHRGELVEAAVSARAAQASGKDFERWVKDLQTWQNNA